MSRGYIRRRYGRDDAACRAGKTIHRLGKDSTMFGMIIGAITFFGFLYIATLIGLIQTA